MEPKVKMGNSEYTIKSLRHFSIFFLILGILTCVASFFIMPIGILVLVLGIFFIYVSYLDRKAIKDALSSPKQSDNGDSSVNESVSPNPRQRDNENSSVNEPVSPDPKQGDNGNSSVDESVSPDPKQGSNGNSSVNESSINNYVKVCPNCGRKQYGQVKKCPDCGADLKNVSPINKDDTDGINAAVNKALCPGAKFVLPDVVKAEIPTDETVKIALTPPDKSWLVCTDKEVFIFKRGFFVNRKSVQGIFREPYFNITGTRLEFHVMTGYLEISTPGTQSIPKDKQDVTTIENSPNYVLLSTTDEAKRDFKAASDYINKKIMEGHDSPSQPQSRTATATDPISKLTQLSELHDKGILTDEEFAAKKADLLKQI